MNVAFVVLLAKAVKGITPRYLLPKQVPLATSASGRASSPRRLRVSVGF